RRAQARLRGLSFKERDLDQIASEDLTRVDACWAVGTGLGLVDTIVGSYFQTRGLLLALDTGEPNRIVRALATEAGFSSASGGKSAERTMHLLQTCEALAKKQGVPYGLAWATGATGLAAALEGRWRQSQDACDKAEATFRDKCTGVTWEIGTMR